MNRLTDEAEAWAESGTRKTEQFRLGPRYSTPPSHIDHIPTVLNRRIDEKSRVRLDAPQMLSGRHQTGTMVRPDAPYDA